MIKKLLFVFGTRPEAIKMAPLVIAARQFESQLEVRVCVTAQHREMLDQVLDFFEIDADYDLNLMRPGQNLYELTAAVITGLKPVLEEYRPEFVFVHGDTTTSTSAALAAFYADSKICHVEAGLRTFDKLSPFPEEMNRQLTGRLTDIHFAPTGTSLNNLLNEGVKGETIEVVGNTVIDALLWGTQKLETYEDDEIRMLKQLVSSSKKLILVTGHRRENFGEGFMNICASLKKLAERQDVQIIYPVHLNPSVMSPVYDRLSGDANILLIKPLSYPAFVWLMGRSYLIITDSGGVQEEAPALGKPVLVMRDTTERPEAVEAGTVKLTGTDVSKITSEAILLLEDRGEYDRMSLRHNPYGDGNASGRILKRILNE